MLLPFAEPNEEWVNGPILQAKRRGFSYAQKPNELWQDAHCAPTHAGDI
jgi:hypothetical protein